MPEKLGFLRLLLVSVFAESAALNPRKCFKLLFIISSPLKVLFTTTQVNQILVPIFEGVLKAYERFLGFCGLNHSENGFKHEVFKNHIWGHRNHNWLRITRVLRCLSLLGYKSEADELLCFVTSLKNVDEETIAYWKKAILTR